MYHSNHFKAYGSVALRTFTLSCSHHHHLSPIPPYFLLPPALGNPHSTLSLWIWLLWVPHFFILHFKLFGRMAVRLEMVLEKDFTRWITEVFNTFKCSAHRFLIFAECVIYSEAGYISVSQSHHPCGQNFLAW